MNDRRHRASPSWPAAAAVLYLLGVLALLAVSLSLGDGETAPPRWALIAAPVSLLAAASILVRRADDAGRTER